MQLNPPTQSELIAEYRDSNNLDARIALHARFSINPTLWTRWIFDHFTFPEEARLLELGCGPATLWLANQERLGPRWDVTLSDFSAGMVETARDALAGLAARFTFREVDAQSIPYEDATFDGVIANHMLYHVPERRRALAEIARVIKPGGRLYATTVGAMHMQELWALAEPFAPGISARAAHVCAGFTLENGAEQLAAAGQFTGITRDDYRDALVVTEVEPLVAYIASSVTLVERDLAAILPPLRAHIAARLAESGALHIAKMSGLFTARRM